MMVHTSVPTFTDTLSVFIYQLAVTFQHIVVLGIVLSVLFHLGIIYAVIIYLLNSFWQFYFVTACL